MIGWNGLLRLCWTHKAGSQSKIGDCQRKQYWYMTSIPFVREEVLNHLIHLVDSVSINSTRFTARMDAS